MVFADCGRRISLSRRICLLTLLVVVAGRFVPAAVRAEAQEDQTLQLRERRQTPWWTLARGGRFAACV